MTFSKIVILFTTSYPYDGAVEQTFLDLEVEHLCSNFDRVIIVPVTRKGSLLSVPRKIEVDESYAVGLEKTKNLEAIRVAMFSLLLYEELATRPRTLVQHPVLESLLKFVAKVEYTYRWALNFIVTKKITLQSTVFYTYWLESFTTGLGLTKKEYPQIKLVSRAHGYDLYEYRRTPPYIPCRMRTLKSLDRLFLISENGRNHIIEQYPWFANFCEVSRLGVKDHNFITSCSKDNIFRIVSCSFMVPVKRLDLLLKGLEVTAQLRPGQKFEWHHFGDGPLSESIQDLVKNINFPNFTYQLHGYVPNEKVLSFYRDNPIDVFVNVSESEGIPVSIMEAQSCAIPVIATAVGGIPEIISNQNGRLLSPNPTPEEISTAICDILDHPEWAIKQKIASHNMWQNRYDAMQNYQTFAERLRSLVDQTLN